MKKVLILAMIMGCGPNSMEFQKIYGCTDDAASNFNPNATVFDNSCVYGESDDGEYLEVEWIYYGNNNQSMAGCYWIGTSFPNQTIGSVDIGMFQFQDSNQNLHTIQCEIESFGQTDYIRHYYDVNSFSIESVGSIALQDYDILIYE